MAKFKKGQTVWGRNPWATYIAEPFIIRDVNESNPEETFYHIKGKRRLFAENELYASEGEAQIYLASVAKQETLQALKKIIDASKRLGCVEQVKQSLIDNSHLLTSQTRQQTTDHLQGNNKPTPKYHVGQTVYGFTSRTELWKFEPKRFTIKTVEVIFVSLIGQPAHWEVVYTVKHHGKAEINEELLFGSEDEATLFLVDYFKDSTQRVLYTFEKRSTALGIEAQVRQALQATPAQLMLE